MKLGQLAFETTLKALDKIAAGLSRTSAMLELLHVGTSTYAEDERAFSDAARDAALREGELIHQALQVELVEEAAARLRREAAKEKRRVELARLLWWAPTSFSATDSRHRAPGTPQWWKALTPELKLVKRMELREKLGRKGPPPPQRVPGDWQWRVHLERQALAKTRAGLRALVQCNNGPAEQQSPALLRAKEEYRHSILRHEHTLAQLRGQHLRPRPYDEAALEATRAHNVVPWTPKEAADRIVDAVLAKAERAT